MSILIADILDNIERLKGVVREPSTAQTLDLYEKYQYEDEEYLVANTQVCGTKELDNIRERMSKLNSEVMKEDVESEFYNKDIMKAASCTINSVIYAPPNEIGTDYHNDKIKDYIKNLHQIGSESVNGYAMLGDFDGIKDFFVEKVSQNPNNDLLIHELVVGLYGTNKLRKFIPNFSYIYGGFKCSPPIIDQKTKKLSSWCLDNDNPVNYVLYENVAPAISINDYVAKCSLTEFLNVYMQVLYSLRLAHNMIDYTHYDLHGENVLIRTPKMFKGSQFQIAYETEKGKEFIVTDKVATFIDYGSSHIKTDNIYNEKGELILEGRHFGVHGLIPYSIYPNRSFIIYDAYRLLVGCMGEAYRNSNYQVYDEIVKIFKFFNNIEDPIEVMSTRDTSILPLIEKTENLQLDDLIIYIRSVCNCDFIQRSPLNVPFLDCEMVCPTEDSILEDFGFSEEIPVPLTILELYDLIIALQDDKPNEIDNVLNDFNYNNAMTEHINDINTIFNNLIIEINSFNNKQHLMLRELTIGELFTSETLSKFRELYSNIGELFNLIDKFYHYADLGIEVAEMYGDGNTIGEIDNLLVDDTISNFENIVIGIIQENSEYLDSFSKEVEKSVTGRDGDIILIDGFEVKQDPKLKWYWETRPLFDNTFFKRLGY